MFGKWKRKRKVKKAEGVKEEGNALFQQGKTAEAWQCYKRALDHLLGLTTSTKDEEKPRDELILALHLNLAACELRLGDNEEVIDHCNKALEMCNTNIKAYYRRGQAHQNKQEYKLAITDYQIGLSLEPDNTLIKSHFDTCQQLLNKGKPSENGMTVSPVSSEDKEDEEREMEVGFEYEAELPARYKNCKKNPGHVNFIPVIDFQMAHLPQEYQDDDLLDLIQQHIKLAVRIKVMGNCEQRPLLVPGTSTPYPFAGIRFRKVLRSGSGWVDQVRIYDETNDLNCPCVSCRTSGEPHKCWSKITVRTATHVVYDLKEGEKTTCYFDYDTDDTDLASCPSVTGAIEVNSDNRLDGSSVKFITHNVELGTKLNKTLWLSRRLSARVKEKFKVAEDSGNDGDVLTKMSKLFDRLCVNLSLFDMQRKKFRDIFEGDIHQTWQEHIAKYPVVAGKEVDMLGCMILSKIHGKYNCEEFLQALDATYNSHREFLVHMADSVKQYGRQMAGHLGEHDQLWEMYALYLTKVTMAEQEVDMYRKILDDDSDGYPVLRPAFCSSHPLTVVISHPHGCSKKITIGQIIERTGVIQNIATQYKYTNDTCPGSSGARVFILGKTGSVYDHPHSGTPGGNINESAAYADI